MGSEGVSVEMTSNNASEAAAATTNRQKKYNKYVVGCTLLASLNSILLGYDIGVMSGALLFIKDDFKLSSVEQEILVGSLNLVALFGGIIAGRLSDAFGRRKTMAIASLIFLIGAILMAAAPSFAVLMAGRVFSGIGVGFALMIAPVYTAELSPSASRGSLVSFAEVFINAGILLGYVANFALSPLRHSLGWRLMLGFGAVPAVLLACGVIVMPESPRWLVMQQRFADAKTVLVRTSGGDKEEAEMRLAAIMEALPEIIDDDDVDDHLPAPSNLQNNDIEHQQQQRSESDAAPAVVSQHRFAHSGSLKALLSSERRDPETKKIKKKKRRNSGGEGVWKELLMPSPPVRRMLLISLGIHFLQQASGVDALVYYSPSVFHQAGIHSRTSVLGMTIAVGLTKTLFILVATIWLDRLGRRPLLLTSATGMTIALLVVATSFRFLHVSSHVDDTPSATSSSSPAAVALALLGICGFMASFSIGFGPCVYVVTSEIFPLTLRAQAMSLSLGVNRLVSGTVAVTFLSISSALTTSGAFYLFASIAGCSIAFIYFLVPETKGKTLEEVCKYFGWNNDNATSKHQHQHQLTPQ